MSGSDFKSDLLKYGYVNYDTSEMIFPGNISATSISANAIYGNVNIVLSGTANLDIIGNVTGNYVTTGNVLANTTTATSFLGNGSGLTGVLISLPRNANVDIVGNVVAPGNVTATGTANVTGNITATYFLGNGALLSGIASGTPSRLNVDITGNVTAPGNVSAGGQVNIVGNVTGNYFLGNGALLQGVLTSLPNRVNIDIVGNVIAPGNVTAARIVSSGNVTANTFIANGALLTGVTTSIPSSALIDIVGNVTAPGNVFVSGQLHSAGNVVSSYVFGNGSLLTGIVTTIPTTIPIDIVGNVTAPGNVFVQGQVRTLGNVVSNSFYGNGSLLQGILATVPNRGNIDITGNVTAPGNIFVQGQVYVVGNVVGSTTNSYLIGNGSLLTNLPWIVPRQANVNLLGNVYSPGNIFVQGNLVSAGNITSSYFIGNGTTLTGVLLSIPSNAAIDITGNILSRGNLLVLDQMNIASNVSANFFFGNGSVLTGILNGLPATAAMDIVGNAHAPGNVLVQGQVNARGNVVASVFSGNGVFVQSIVANLPAFAYIDIVGNVFAPGDVTIAGDANVTGNVTSPFFFGNGDFLTNIITVLPQVIAADITGNVRTAGVGTGYVVALGQIRSLGNVVGPYLVGNGSLLQNVPTPLPSTSSIDILGNVLAPGDVFAQGRMNVSGNATSAFFVGNGALLSGISQALSPTTRADILGNVTSFGNVVVAGTANVAGNVTASYLIGNGKFLTNVLQSFPLFANIDVYGNVLSGSYATLGNINASVIGNVGNVIVTNSNVTARYFRGNGTELTGVLTSIPTLSFANVLSGNIIGNVMTPIVLKADGTVTASNSAAVGGIATCKYLIGNGYSITYPGIFLNPYGTVSDQAARLALTGISPGAYVTQTDVASQFLLTTLPASANANWIQLTIPQSNVMSVFGRTGGVVASTNDYNDSQINLFVPVGTIPATANLSNALVYLNALKANIVNGVVTSPYFFGPVLSPGNVDATNVSTSRFLLQGNANVSGQVNVVGNVTQNYVFGNGFFLTGVTFPYPTLALIDITGNVTAPGSISVAGQATVVGNVIAPFLRSATLASNLLDTFSNVITVDTITNTQVPNGSSPVILNGQVNVTANVTSSGSMLGNLVNNNGLVVGNTFVGNLVSRGNIDANVVTANFVNVYGNVFITGNTVSRGISLTGNISVAGNVNIGGLVLLSPVSTGGGLPFMPQGDTSNYTPLYINTTSNALTTYPSRLTWFANVNNQLGNTGLMFVYKDTLYASGRGWTDSNPNFVYGYIPKTVVPTPIMFPGISPPVTGIKTVVHDPFNGAVLTSDGRVFWWGRSIVSSTGVVGSWLPIRVTFPGGALIDKLYYANKRLEGVGSVSNVGTFAAISTTGILYMWGANNMGQLGLGNVSLVKDVIQTPLTPSGLTGLVVKKVAISQSDIPSVAAILANGKVYVWGMNTAGELGIGNFTSPISTPTLISAGLIDSQANVTDVVFGGLAYSTTLSRQSCRVLLSNGATGAAGFNTSGELGTTVISVGSASNTFRRESTNMSNVAAIGTIQSGCPAHYAIINNGNILFCGNTNAFGVNSSPSIQTVFTQSIGDASVGNVMFYGFQGAMLSNVGTGAAVTNPKIITTSSGTANSDRYSVYVLDRTGNLYGSRYNRLGNFGNGAALAVSGDMLSGFININQFFPPGNSQVIDVTTGGNPNASSQESGTIVSLADGTVLATGVNQYGSVPNTYAPSELNDPGNTAVPFWTPMIGRLNDVRL